MITDSLKAVASIVQHVPVYKDLAQPVCVELGKSLETCGKVINAALLPVRVLGLVGDRAEAFVANWLAPKMQSVPTERIVTPPARIAVPLLEAASYSGSEEFIADMYANLLATAMDSSRDGSAHPAFVNIIKDLSPDEAKILKSLEVENSFAFSDLYLEDAEMRNTIDGANFLSMAAYDAGCAFPDNIEVYLNNLVRLGILEARRGKSFQDKTPYDRIKECDSTVAMLKRFANEHPRRTPRFEYGVAAVTEFGSLFITVCVQDFKSGKNQDNT